VPLRETEQDIMLTFAERAGIAMRNAHTLDQAQKLSVTDSVTGLPNHRYFHTRFDEELEKTKDAGGSITVMMIDLDRFKVYNDSFGHAAGDVALKAAARTISSTMRREDTVTRYGGEEFVGDPAGRRPPDGADPGPGDLRHPGQGVHVQPQNHFRPADGVRRLGDLPGRRQEPGRAVEPGRPGHVYGQEARPELHLRCL